MVLSVALNFLLLSHWAIEAAWLVDVPVRFYGFYAPADAETIVFNGGCAGDFRHNFSKAKVKSDHTWVMMVNLPDECHNSGLIQFKWSTEPATKWENWGSKEVYREIPTHLLRKGNTAGYTIFGYKTVAMKQLLQFQFVLDLSGGPSDDIYTVCGRCAGDSPDPQRETWRCEEGARAGINGKVVILYNLYKHCNFYWKWRNLNQSDNGGYEPPNNGHDDNNKNNDRIFQTGDEVCIRSGYEKQIKTVVTTWGEMLTSQGSRESKAFCLQMISRVTTLSPLLRSSTSSTPSANQQTRENLYVQKRDITSTISSTEAIDGGNLTGIRFNGYGAPSNKSTMYLNGGCGSVNNFKEAISQVSINLDGTWSLSAFFSLPCQLIWKWKADGEWEEINITNRNTTLSRREVVHTVFRNNSNRPSKVLIELPAMFTLTKQPKDKLNDSYSVCGRCNGINYLFPFGLWKCSEPAKIVGAEVTIVLNIYAHCDFEWKWRNLNHSDSSGNSYEFDGDKRNFHFGDGCGENMIHHVQAEWDKKRENDVVDCVPLPTVTVQSTSGSPLQTTSEDRSRSTAHLSPTTGNHVTTNLSSDSAHTASSISTSTSAATETSYSETSQSALAIMTSESSGTAVSTGSTHQYTTPPTVLSISKEVVDRTSTGASSSATSGQTATLHTVNHELSTDIQSSSGVATATSAPATLSTKSRFKPSNNSQIESGKSKKKSAKASRLTQEQIIIIAVCVSLAVVLSVGAIVHWQVMQKKKKPATGRSLDELDPYISYISTGGDGNHTPYLSQRHTVETIGLDDIAFEPNQLYESSGDQAEDGTNLDEGIYSLADDVSATPPQQNRLTGDVMDENEYMVPPEPVAVTPSEYMVPPAPVEVPPPVPNTSGLQSRANPLYEDSMPRKNGGKPSTRIVYSEVRK